MSNSFTQKQPNRKERRRQARNERKANVYNIQSGDSFDYIPDHSKINLNLVPKSAEQKKYINLINSFTYTVALGKAGTGKTYPAAALAGILLELGEIEKIVLTRPNVDLEESKDLGSLPGELYDKYKFWLAPVLDVLLEIGYSEARIKYLVEKNVIQFVPMNMIRGRSFNDSFIIVDESGNITWKQMKALITRLGQNSKMVISGDLAQCDLRNKSASGLPHLLRMLEENERSPFAVIELTECVRSKEVAWVLDTIEAYEDKYGIS